MDPTAPEHTTDGCQGVSEVLSTIGDKWTVQVLVALLDHPRRFNEIKRHVAGISQQMLTRVLRSLERDGMVLRTVYPSTPPQVEYALTELGSSLSETVRSLAVWATQNRKVIRANRDLYDAKRE
jgi:DNA-binding HxlR family transcriptional regulator